MNTTIVKTWIYNKIYKLTYNEHLSGINGGNKGNMFTNFPIFKF
jgi:hypothetical protein